jgi:hypothetical protein
MRPSAIIHWLFPWNGHCGTSLHIYVMHIFKVIFDVVRCCIWGIGTQNIKEIGFGLVIAVALSIKLPFVSISLIVILEIALSRGVSVVLTSFETIHFALSCFIIYKISINL